MRNRKLKDKYHGQTKNLAALLQSVTTTPGVKLHSTAIERLETNSFKLKLGGTSKNTRFAPSLISKTVSAYSAIARTASINHDHFALYEYFIYSKLHRVGVTKSYTFRRTVALLTHFRIAEDISGKYSFLDFCKRPLSRKCTV